MELAAKIAMLVACAFNFGVQSLYFTHMLQLNSYRNERYRKWCRDNETKLVSVRRILPVLLIPAMYLPVVWGYGAAAAILLLTGLLNLPKKAKKPLVFTNRVRRLLATQALLLAAVLTLAFFSAYLRAIGFTALFSLIIWAWTWLANTINHPLEKHIADGYVKDARARLQAMPNLIVVGITGSYGKTSAKNFLHDLLAVEYNVLMTPESYNTTMGVVRTIRERLRPSHQVFIAEMGAKNPGDIREICDLVHPRYGILTSIGEQHLESFGTVDTIIDTKFELYDAIPADGLCFLNEDNEYIATRKVGSNVVRYGLEGERDYKASDITVTPSGTEFTVSAPDGESFRYKTRLLGEHNVQNITAAIAVCHKLGISLEELQPAVRRLEPVPHRMQLIRGGSNYTVIDDAYNSNPKGAQAALRTLSMCQGLRILVEEALVPFDTAVNACTINPARCLGADRRKGRIAAGFDADLTVLDRDYNVLQTWCRGRKCLN